MTNDEDTLLLAGTFGSTKRSGAWEVPSQVVLRRRFGSAELDLTQAKLASSDLTFDIDMVGGSIELRVPTAMRVTSALETKLASYEDHRKTAPDGSAGTLTLTGRAVFGSVEVRGPKQGSDDLDDNGFTVVGGHPRRRPCGRGR